MNYERLTKGLDADALDDLRYEIGDLLGDRAPDSLRRGSRWPTGLMIGAGGVLFALGIGYVAMKLADRRLERMFDRAMPGRSTESEASTQEAEVSDRAGEAAPASEESGETAASTEGTDETAGVGHTNGAEVTQP